MIRELKVLGVTREAADASRDGYDPAAWKAGRVVALIRPDPRGGLDIFRFDRH